MKGNKLSSYAYIEKKFRRALRNESGTTLAFEDLALLLELGLLKSLSTAVNDEMGVKWKVNNGGVLSNALKPASLITWQEGDNFSVPMKGSSIRDIEALIAAP